MSQTAQALYFHLGIDADDDGVVEAYPVMKLTNSADDDFKILVAKKFIQPLNNEMVTYILDWNEHNQIRADRKINSIYKDLLVQILPEVKVVEPKPRADTGVIPRQLPTGRPVDNQRTTKGRHRLGKVSVGEVRLEKTNHKSSDVNVALNPLILLFKEVNPNYENIYKSKTERGALQRMVDKFGGEKVESAIKKLPDVINKKYAPKITTPYQLEKDLGKLIAFVRQEEGAGMKITKV